MVLTGDITSWAAAAAAAGGGGLGRPRPLAGLCNSTQPTLVADGLRCAGGLRNMNIQDANV